MAGKKQGLLGHNDNPTIDSGTMCRNPSFPPGSLGCQNDYARLSDSTHTAIEHMLRQFIWNFRDKVFGVSDKELAAYEKEFEGTRGDELKRRVLDAAQAVKINPGLLAADLLFEQGSADFWTRNSGEVSTYKAGADHFYDRSGRIKREIPEAGAIRTTRPKKISNEPGNPVTEAYVPATQAVLVVAATLKDRENTMRRLFREEGSDFDALPQHVRFFLTRLAFNPGKGFTLRERVRQILEAEDLLVTRGKRDSGRPQRGATICTALAIRLNVRIFGDQP
jgi:hypothetical protein